VGLELKAPKGRLSKLQELKLQEVQRVGGAAIVAHSGNWEKVKAYLTAMDQGEELI
jgi:hypothetical protein